MTEEKIEGPDGQTLTVLVDGPSEAQDLVILAPGAGADITHVFMERAAVGLGAKGLRVCRFNFPYMEAGRKAPDRAPVLEGAYRSVLDWTACLAAKRTFVGGKSMGGRIASHVVSQGTEAAGLVFLGYPLHPPGRPDRLRDAHLYDIYVPVLFVEGSRDPFCPLETLERVRTRIPGHTEVHVVRDGDHSFKVRKSSGRTSDQAWDEVVEAVTDWIARQ